GVLLDVSHCQPLCSDARHALQKTAMTAAGVPRWSATAKVRSSAIPPPNGSRATMRWPEYDTGRNSVSPWITPSTMARRMSSIHRPAYGSESRRVYYGLVNRWPLFAIAWAAALAGFVLLSILAAVSDKFPGDVWLAHRIQEIDVPSFARALDWAEHSAGVTEVILVCAVAVAALLLVRDAAGAIILPVIVSARVLITWALKELIERPRPSAALVHFENQPSTFSFPSGH